MDVENCPDLGDIDEYAIGPLAVDLGEFPARNGEDRTGLFPNSLPLGTGLWLLFSFAKPPNSLARSFTDTDAMVKDLALPGWMEYYFVSLFIVSITITRNNCSYHTRLYCYAVHTL